MNTEPNPGQPEPGPLSPEPTVPRSRSLRVLGVATVAVVLALLFFHTPMARAAWQEISQLLSLQGKPEPASAAVSSEHEIEVLDKMSPQSQAELLLERSINHYRGSQLLARGACRQLARAGLSE